MKDKTSRFVRKEQGIKKALKIIDIVIGAILLIPLAFAKINAIKERSMDRCIDTSSSVGIDADNYEF